MIKWPNDLVCKGRKICGILLELSADPDRIEYVVIGVGLNVRREAVPEDLRTQAAGIEDFIDPPLRRHILLCYLSELEKTLDVLTEKGFYGISQEYIKKSATIGQPVRICGHETWTGVAENVDDTGALLVRDEQGELRRVLSGDVSVRGVMGYV